MYNWQIVKRQFSMSVPMFMFCIICYYLFHVFQQKMVLIFISDKWRLTDLFSRIQVSSNAHEIYVSMHYLHK